MVLGCTCLVLSFSSTLGRASHTSQFLLQLYVSCRPHHVYGKTECCKHGNPNVTSQVTMITRVWLTHSLTPSVQYCICGNYTENWQNIMTRMSLIDKYGIYGQNLTSLREFRSMMCLLWHEMWKKCSTHLGKNNFI